MKTKIKSGEESNQFKRPAMSVTGHGSEDNAPTVDGSSRREFMQIIVLMSGGAAAAVMLNMVPGVAHAADVVPNASNVVMILVDGNPLENLDLVADADRNFVMIMKDGKIYKNTVQ